jgi:hypothetical protein
VPQWRFESGEWGFAIGAPYGQGALSVVSTGAAVLTVTGALTDVPGLSLGVNLTPSTSAIVISSDGGVQVNSALTDQAVVVDLHLFVDGDVTPRQIVQRRIYAVNNVVVPNVANWSFSAAVSGLSAGTHTIRVAASLVVTNGSAAVVGGSSTMNAHLRGTLTAVVVNR